MGNPSDLFLLRNGNYVIGNRRFYSYFVMGKPSVLFLLRNWNYVVKPSSEGPSRCNRPRNACCLRDAIAFATLVAFNIYAHNHLLSDCLNAFMFDSL
jgi:hypothetical protein